jgi:molybdopterin-biosynthesis enzyme MoeA-like protein
MKSFGAIIIGDEILSGKRVDRHFAKIAELLSVRGLRLSWVEYLGDERGRIADSLRRSLAAGDIVFSFGGIGNTPDDHTRQAAAAALSVDLVLHPDAEREIRARFGAEITDVRLLLGTFPRGVEIIPNPFNRIPGFRVRDHHFLPGFPQMAHPMANGRSIPSTRSVRPAGLRGQGIPAHRQQCLRECAARPDGADRRRLSATAAVQPAVDGRGRTAALP